MEFYHSELVREVRVDVEVPALATFQQQYRLALLDLCRVVVADHWRQATPATLAARAAMPDNQKKVFNAYNKDLGVAGRLVARMVEELEALDKDWTR